MKGIRTAAAAVALSTIGLAAATPSRAAPVLLNGGVNQHATVMNNIGRAQQRNNAAIRHVQSSIRSSQPRR